MKNYLYILLILSLLSCKKEKEKLTNGSIIKVEKTIKYATGFDIKKTKEYTVLIIKSPFPDAKKNIEYVLTHKKLSDTAKKITDFTQATVIQVPIKRIVTTSTTHIPMLELLNEETSLVGFPHAKYISSPKTRALIDNGKITELGKEQSINTEILIDLNPDAVIGFSLSSNNKMFATIEKFGIPVILNGDWLEKTPLGRAEWIKFFGVLYGKEELANKIFNNIELEYNKVKNLAKNSKTKPKVLSGVMHKDKWNLPAGESYVAQYLQDANLNYHWQNTKGNGSVSLSFESVSEKANDASIWIGPGYFDSFNQLEEANQHYTQFDAFKNKKVYNFTKRKGKTGGVLYYELAPMQPHIVLKDIIKVTHPELLDSYVPFYLDAIED
jgi:iron complex transport system substrate-binding protein